jgi:copper resistance protein B
MNTGMRILSRLAALIAFSSLAMAQTPPSSGFQSKPADANWPEPVRDSATFGLLLLDEFEYQSIRGSGAISWDAVAWRGGDYHRLWIKSEGRHNTSSSAGSDGELQLLYGKSISPFFDAQAGVRVDRHFRDGKDMHRAYAVVGLQGLAPYRFELEPTLFISNKGQVSGRIKATYDVLFTQRLVFQPRLEASAALKRDEAIGVGSGLNDVEIGTRLRYEVRREFAPYIGVTWSQSIGVTHGLAARPGGDASHLAVVGGVRIWF